MTHYLSKKKYQELENELIELSNAGRKEIGLELDRAKSFGDLKENAEYHQAREDQAKMEGRILELEATLKDTEIIKDGHYENVQIGAEVTISKKGSSKESIFHIVGSEETDVSSGNISYQAPLVVAMLGKKENDVFDFTLPSGDIVGYKIIKIK